MMKTLRQIAGSSLALLPLMAAANYDVNIPAPHTPISNQIYGLHMEILWVCLAIFVVVFGVMFYSVFAHRKSKGAVAAHFHENTTIEIIWTLIPFLILGFMAWPATKTVLAMKDASNPDMTIKVTAYQWKWQYDYLNDGVKFYSTLSTPRSEIGSPGEPGKPVSEHYLLETDNNVVVPVGKKIRLLITANDVIHGWYVPQLGVNQYGIPGFIKDSWFQANEPGVYRGQCSQICGKEHGYMPIVVEAKSAEDYAAWVKEQKAKQAAAEGHEKVSMADPVTR